MQIKLFDFVNLHSGEEDKAKVLENVTANTSFRGSNLWILACAIIISLCGTKRKFNCRRHCSHAELLGQTLLYLYRFPR